MDYRLLCPWDTPGKNTRMGCHALLQGIFPTQESNPHLLCLLHCKQILYPLSHLGSFLKSCHSFHCWVWLQNCPKIMGYQGHLILFYLFFFWGGVHHTACGILVFWPMVKPQLPALEVQSFLTTRPPQKPHEHLTFFVMAGSQEALACLWNASLLARFTISYYMFSTVWL